MIQEQKNKDINISDIQALIDKYEDKIKSIHNIIDNDKSWYNRDIKKEDNERLNVRIYERNCFIKDLKELLK
jgi:hypothetical protein